MRDAHSTDCDDAPGTVPATPSRHGQKISARDRLLATLMAHGYTDIRLLDDQICAVLQFAYTTAVVVGVGDVGYHRRYCYEHRADATAALANWDGREHPPGPWIKCKGGGIELINPEFGRDPG